MSGGLTKSGIYKITNAVNGKCYIGSAVNLAKRITNHKCHLKKGSHKNPKLQASWVKYGPGAFIFDVIELVQEKIDLIEREQHFIDTINPHFNIARTAGSNLGKVFSAESRQKMSESGKKRPPATLETRAKISAACKERGFSDLCRERARSARTGAGHSEEARVKISEAQRGRKIAEDQKSKISESMKLVWAGRNDRAVSAETRSRMSESVKKRAPISDETRSKIAATSRGRKQSAETIAKRVASRKAGNSSAVLGGL